MIEFGSKVKLKNPSDHESHYQGIIGVVVAVEVEPDNEIMVWFQGDYEAESRDAEELELI